MNSKRTQSGITFIGFLFLLAVIGFFAYMGMILFPVYSEYSGVSKAVETLAKEPSSADKTLDALRSELMFKFSLQYVSDGSVPVQAIRVLTVNGLKTLDVAYERRIHFISNIDFAISFHKTATLSHVSSP
ncbi:DUF4845 domain-containing protein [Pseudolysobacter antarcticus]|uniref:DUF4845 domain-containing protein n=1 Tax=Pseudolysobacter antarcticus TaxID=2511995 RepID=A0A411HJH9_9GAMM|nr:DUF4845 domain-containing protein [Pseudolysobacter antarcticus]QBB70641.1 DUF4845 domain-containing protein [Pseudolysobacter antarcticus]